MKSTEIQKTAPTDLSTNGWLKMVALQLAILIESLAAPAPELSEPVPAPPVIVKRGPGLPRKQ